MELLASAADLMRIQIRCNKCGEPTGAESLIYPGGLMVVDETTRTALDNHNDSHEGTHHG